MPVGITCNARDEIFVADRQNHRVQKLSQDGRFINGYGGAGVKAGSLHYPEAVAVVDDRLFVVDTGNHRIQVRVRRLLLESLRVVAAHVIVSGVVGSRLRFHDVIRVSQVLDVYCLQCTMYNVEQSRYICYVYNVHDVHIHRTCDPWCSLLLLQVFNQKTGRALKVIGGRGGDIQLRDPQVRVQNAVPSHPIPTLYLPLYLLCTRNCTCAPRLLHNTKFSLPSPSSLSGYRH